MVIHMKGSLAVVRGREHNFMTAVSVGGSLVALVRMPTLYGHHLISRAGVRTLLAYIGNTYLFHLLSYLYIHRAVN